MAAAFERKQQQYCTECQSYTYTFHANSIYCPFSPVSLQTKHGSCKLRFCVNTCAPHTSPLELIALSVYEFVYELICYRDTCSGWSPTASLLCFSLHLCFPFPLSFPLTPSVPPLFPSLALVVLLRVAEGPAAGRGGTLSQPLAEVSIGDLPAKAGPCADRGADRVGAAQAGGHGRLEGERLHVARGLWAVLVVLKRQEGL